MHGRPCSRRRSAFSEPCWVMANCPRLDRSIDSSGCEEGFLRPRSTTAAGAVGHFGTRGILGRLATAPALNRQSSVRRYISRLRRCDLTDHRPVRLTRTQEQESHDGRMLLRSPTDDRRMDARRRSHCDATPSWPKATRGPTTSRRRSTPRCSRCWNGLPDVVVGARG